MFNPCTLTNIYQQMKQKKHFSYNLTGLFFSFVPQKISGTPRNPEVETFVNFDVKKKKIL